MGAWLKPKRLQGGVINIICDAEIFDALFEFSGLFASGGHDEVNGVDIGRFCLTTEEVDVNMVGFQCRALRWIGGGWTREKVLDGKMQKEYESIPFQTHSHPIDHNAVRRVVAVLPHHGGGRCWNLNVALCAGLGEGRLGEKV